MKYENAKRGVAMIFTAEILELIASILTGGTLAAKDSAQAIGLVGVLVGLVLVIVAAVKEIKGLILAGKDEKSYKHALYLTIFYVVIDLINQIVPMFFPDLKFSPLVFSADLFNILCLLYVVQGTNALLKELGNEDMVKKGKVALCYNIVAFAIMNTLEATMAVTESGNAGIAVMAVLAVACAVVMIIGYIKYLSYLKKAADEL